MTIINDVPCIGDPRNLDDTRAHRHFRPDPQLVSVRAMSHDEYLRAHQSLRHGCRDVRKDVRRNVRQRERKRMTEGG